MSPVLPSESWIEDLSVKLDMSINSIKGNYPLILIDSEGMGVRDELFDFMTTSPPAIVSKVIVWVSEGKVETNYLLKDIQSYMNGLDNIILDENRQEKYCAYPYYGHFIIAVNKLMDDTSDYDLGMEIMGMESGGSGATERNEIRRKMKECFNGVSVYGFPYLTIDENQDFDYSVLDDRFRLSLHKIASDFARNLQNPRNFSVGSDQLMLDSSNVKDILAMVIEQANYDGTIDVMGFLHFWNSKKQEFNDALSDYEPMLQNIVQHGCDETQASISCTNCICQFRAEFLSGCMRNMDKLFREASLVADAKFGVDLERYSKVSTKANFSLLLFLQICHQV